MILIIIVALAAIGGALLENALHDWENRDI
jgi:hypothetical protein